MLDHICSGRRVAVTEAIGCCCRGDMDMCGVVASVAMDHDYMTSGRLC